VVDRAKRLGVRSLRVRPWTAAELQYLEKNYPRRTAEQIARTLGRSLQSIRGQIHLSGLGAEPPARWSERELAYLRRTYGRSTIAEIARDLGRTPAAVQLKGGKLGLQRKVRQPGKRDVAWVIANLGRLSMEAMSRRLGISVNAVQRIARQKGYAPKSHLRRWSQTEDEFIRRNYATMTCRELGQALGRSLDMVSWRTRRLGLTDGEHRKQVRWRPAEEKILIASFGRCDREEIARKLGRTVRAVESRIERLKRLGKIR
jgi:predicted transcriptional regulator